MFVTIAAGSQRGGAVGSDSVAASPLVSVCQPTPAASVLVMYWLRLTSSRSAASASSA